MYVKSKGKLEDLEVDYDDILLSHLLNLYNASLIFPSKLNQLINLFRKEIN